MMIAFSDVFADVTKQGTKLQTSEYLASGKYPIIDQGQDDIAGYTDREDGLFTDVPAIIFGDHTRIVKYVDMPFFLGADGVKVLKATIPDVDYRYLYYAVSAVKIPNTGYNRHFKWLKEAQISLPDLSTQRRISDTLDKVSEGIEVCRRMLGELDLMVKAKFGEMFGDPVSNEREWNVETLNDVCTEIGDGLHGTPEYDDNGEYPFINGNNLINGAIEITPATKKVNAEIYKKHYIDISANALLLSINGTLGKLAFYNGEKVMLGKSACYCNFKPEINRAFVYGVMKTEAFAGFLEKSATASTIKNVGLKAIRGYKLIMPPQALQMQFIEFSNQVDKSKLAVKQSLEKLETLKKSLMQEYLG